MSFMIQAPEGAFKQMTEHLKSVREISLVSKTTVIYEN
jgi:hypothetical protein